MRKYIEERKYKALGFVEALIAIMIVGISSVVLMQIAVNTMQNTVQNEVIDNMTQYAVEGSEIAQNIANRELESSGNVFPDKEDWGSCFTFVENDNPDSFSKTSENVFQTFNEEDRDLYKDAGVIQNDDELFRIICLDENTGTEEPSFVIGRVIVGQRNSDGTITTGNQVKDYEYLTVIKL